MPAVPPTSLAVRFATTGAAAVMAQFVAGKATRDALFLTRFDVTRLPLMVMVASVFSIACAFLMSRVMRRVSPARILPPAFLASAALVLLEWAAGSVYPRGGAVLFYLHMLGVAPVLVSGFWTLVSERLDLRTAKRRLGHVGGAATLGGLIGSAVAGRTAVWGTASVMLPIVAIMNVACAWAVWHLALVGRREGETQSGASLDRTPPPGGLVVLTRNAHLRNVAALVLLTTLGAALLDYVFKARTVSAIGRGDTLLRFFALYYGAQGALTFLAQITMTRSVLERFGLAPAVGSPSLAVVAGGLGSLLIPGMPSVVVAKGSEFVCRVSLFQSAYELLYLPVPAPEKRAAKSIIDVGFDRGGDLAGAALTRLVLGTTRTAQHSVILVIAVAASAAALLFARRVTRGYIQTLERSLADHAVRLDLSEAEDLTTRATIARSLERLPSVAGTAARQELARVQADSGGSRESGDAYVRRVVALRSRDRERVVRVLREDHAPDRALVPLIIPLLAWDLVAPDAVLVLRKVADESVGQLVDSLIDARQDVAIRRRLARVLSACTSQRAVDGLLMGLDDRFEVRFQCGRSLAAISDRNCQVRIEADRIYQVVLREVSVSRPVWESHRLLGALDEGDDEFFVDRFIRERAGQSMAHVFTLLSLVLHREPLQIAFRGLHVEDALLRGTALEYLESVLPQEIRLRLWPFLEDARPRAQRSRSRDEILGDLLRSNDSITLHLAELERRGGRMPNGPGKSG